MSFSVKFGEVPAVSVKIGGLVIDGGYDEGYTAGKADAEAADAAEDAALLDKINAALSAAGADAAEALGAVAGRIPEVYERAYAAGEKSQYIAEIKDGVFYLRTKMYAGIENNVMYLREGE